MDTKLKSDIAESAVITELLKRGYKVLKPIGDRLPYDLAVDLDGKLVRIQVKSAWFHQRTKAFCVDVRRTKTNRRRMLRSRYDKNDFDCAVVYLESLHVFYVMPVSVFERFGSTITIIETKKGNANQLQLNIENVGIYCPRALQLVTVEENLSNSVKPSKFRAIPSQARQQVGKV